MKPQFSKYLPLIIAVVLSGCSSLYRQSQWQVKPLKIDGKITEWPLPLPCYDQDTKINYVISNDEKNLYISFRVPDEQTQMKMLMAGFTFSIDTMGKKQQSIAIDFPLRLDPHKRYMPASARQNQKMDGQKIKRDVLDVQTELQLNGFKKGINGLSTLNKSTVVKVAMNLDSSGVLSYEACIPFGSFYKDHLNYADTLKKWRIGFKINGIEAPREKDTHNDMGDNMETGGGFGGGSMHIKGGGRNGPGPENPMVKAATSWMYLRLRLK